MTAPFNSDQSTETRWRVPDPDPVEFTYPESLVVYGALQREVRYRRYRIANEKGVAQKEQRKLERALSAMEKLNAASHHPEATPLPSCANCGYLLAAHWTACNRCGEPVASDEKEPGRE